MNCLRNSQPPVNPTAWCGHINKVSFQIASINGPSETLADCWLPTTRARMMDVKYASNAQTFGLSLSSTAATSHVRSRAGELHISITESINERGERPTFR